MSFNSQALAMAAETSARQRDGYRHGLAQLQPAGRGHNTHGSLLGVANKGVRANIPADTIAADIRRHLPPGDRPVTDAEIRSAVATATRDNGKTPPSSVQPRRPCVDRRLLAQLVEAGRGSEPADIVRASPVPVPDDPKEQQRLVLSMLYAPDEHLFIGDKFGADVLPAEAWLEKLDAGSRPGPHIIPNPLSGEESLTKDGKTSRRCDACVASFRFAVVEFDNLPVHDQLAFWSAVRLPVAALIHSGGKSLHAWLRVDASDRAAWERDVEAELFAGRLIPLGVDASCRNESRLSRMPGSIRGDNGRLQSLLYLAPEGKAVAL
jgi:hypothetical protein